MYIIKTTKGDVIKLHMWTECPNVKLSSLELLSPDLKSNLKIEGYGHYVCMKEALMSLEGFKIVANICYAFNKKYAVKYRITDNGSSSTLINNNVILDKSINNNIIRYGEKLSFVI